MGYLKIEIVMRKHANNSHAHVNSFSKAQKKFLVHMYKSVFLIYL